MLHNAAQVSLTLASDEQHTGRLEQFRRPVCIMLQQVLDRLPELLHQAASERHQSAEALEEMEALLCRRQQPTHRRTPMKLKELYQDMIDADES